MSSAESSSSSKGSGVDAAGGSTLRSRATNIAVTPKRAGVIEASSSAKWTLREQLYVAGLLTMIGLSLWFFRSVQDVVTERQERRRDYVYPRFEDFWLTVQAMVVLCTLRVILTRTLFQWIGQLVIDPRFVGDERKERVSRFAAVFFKFNFFVVYTTFGFWLLTPAEWVPPSLGGSGHIINAFTNYPFQEQLPYMKEYYLISLAYHGHSLVFHLLSPRRNDFLEMLLHHVIAVFLVGFSYLLNFVRGGSLIILLHDVADVPGYLVKSTVDTRHKYLTLAVYLSLLAVWGYYRLFVYPFHVVFPVLDGRYPVIAEALSKDGNFLPFFAFMMLTLQVMHVLWYVLFLQMGFNFLKSGKTEDIQQRIKKRPAGAAGSHVDPANKTH